MKSIDGFKQTIRKNDLVQVMAGREKGKTGKVLLVDRATGRVTIEKINMVKRHVKPTQKNPQGGIVEKELPLHRSNVLLFCSKCNRGVRIGARVSTAAKETKKERVCKRCDSVVGTA